MSDVPEPLALSIVIPAFNEEDNIEVVIRESVEVLSNLTPTWDIVVVDDVSTDATPEILDRLAQEIPQLTVIRNEENIGCHPSTLVGWPLCQGEYRYFIPSDRQIPPGEIMKFVNKAREGCDVVYSWRVKRADPLHRRILGRTYNLILRTLFGITVHDADSSSLLTRRAVESILPRLQLSSALLTTEILLEARRQGLKIGEVVIEHRPRIAGVARGFTWTEFCRMPLNFLNMLWWFWQQKLKR